MTGIFDKVRTITLSNIHAVLNAVIDMNSIGALEQYSRDLQKARDLLDDEAATQRSRVRTLPVEISSLEQRHKEANKNIDTLLGDSDPSNDHLAAPLEAQMIQLEAQIKSKKDQLETAKSELAKFSEAVNKLDTKYASTVGRIEVLRDLEKTAKGKERASKLLSGVELGDQPNVDNIEQRLRERADVAGNKLDRSLSRVGDAVADAGLDATVAARLAQRRQALATKTGS